MTPAFLDGVLAAAGISPEKLVLSLANNHVLDQGVAGFDETVARLAERGIRAIGTVADGLLRRADVGPLTIGLLAFTQWRNANAQEFTGRVRMADGIAGWREQAGGVDLVCAVPHWDLEFRHFPGQETRALARSLAGDGAGLVVGGHAHVVQPVERIGDALVAYGLGDFLGTVFSRTPSSLRIGAMLAVEIGAEDATKGKVAAYRVVPFVRKQHGRHERLVAVEGGDEKTTDRLERIFTRDGTLGSGGGEVR
jgi:poly-gamma-glutamate synthesis protein (capsule biosynthesis protein)